jgi:hypothetical protein
MFPRIVREDSVETLWPYYVTLNLIDRSRFEHLLLAPLNPKGRDNMRAFAVVSSDAENYGRIIVYSLPTGMLVLGLSQIDALIEQDSTIAEQFTLWGRGGAEIERGKLILILLDEVITYVQPVYLQAAQGVTIPQLKRVIVSQRGKVAMAPSLEEAVAALRERQRRDRARAGAAPGAQERAPQPDSGTEADAAASGEAAATAAEALSGGSRPNAPSGSGLRPG